MGITIYLPKYVTDVYALSLISNRVNIIFNFAFLLAYFSYLVNIFILFP
jgi:hypothetical protein